MRIPTYLRSSAFRLLAIPAIAGIVLALIALRPVPGSAAGDCTIGESEIALDVNEQQMLQLINDYRRQNGRSDLVASPGLNKAAAWLANDMAQRRVMSHTDSLGRGLDRLADCGYRYYPAGENVAYGTGTLGGAQSAFNSWRGSAGHNANMLNASYKAAGIGRACNGSACFWALDLGGVVDGLTPVTTQPVDTSQSVPQTTSSQLNSTFTNNSFTNNSTGYTTTPTYYTYQTMPSTIQSLLGQSTYWVYSNGRWYGYNPYRLSGSDNVSSRLSGLYYFIWR
jgi:uncharacterized protein YkwD